jgi:UDP-2,3-diacylglucosamine pyrophosphatase LpxH
MKSILVIADTHLGLKSKNINCEPDRLNDFFEWIEFIESSGEGIEVKSRFGSQISRRIYSPEKILILGDAIELWDASDRSIYLCLKTILNRIEHLKADMVYLTGNHDYLIGKNQGSYPLHNSKLTILPDTYPVQDDKSKIETVKKGNCEFLFLHGHQFDKTFRRVGKGAMLMSYLRDGAEALGAYSWIALSFFFIFLMGYLITKLLNIPTNLFIDFLFFEMNLDLTFIKSPSPWWMIIIIMGIFSLPRGLVSVARPIWNKIFKTRYKRDKAIKGFFDWWNSFSKNRECKAKMLNIVYGHTHILDFITDKRALTIVGRSSNAIKLGVKINLLNIPSWVNDSSEDVLKDIILYIDETGIEFLEWDSEEKEPFIFPMKTLLRKSYDIQMSDEEISHIKKLTEEHTR